MNEWNPETYNVLGQNKDNIPSACFSLRLD